eukprot:scaffold804_cov98-Isochrysis_galbana.AAC.1
MCLHITKNRHGTRPSDAEAETREKTSRGPRTTQTARCRSGRIPGATAAQLANAATPFWGVPHRAQPPKTAPNRDLRRGTSGATWCHTMGSATGHSGSLSAGGGHTAADAGRQRAHLPSSQPQSRANGAPSNAVPHAKFQRTLAGASAAAPLDAGGLGGGAFTTPAPPPGPPPPTPLPSPPRRRRRRSRKYTPVLLLISTRSGASPRTSASRRWKLVSHHTAPSPRRPVQLKVPVGVLHGRFLQTCGPAGLSKAFLLRKAVRPGAGSWPGATSRTPEYKKISGGTPGSTLEALKCKCTGKE